MTNIEFLDSYDKKDHSTFLLGKYVALIIIENPMNNSILSDPDVKKLICAKNLCEKDTIKLIDELIKKESNWQLVSK